MQETNLLRNIQKNQQYEPTLSEIRSIKIYTLCNVYLTEVRR